MSLSKEEFRTTGLAAGIGPGNEEEALELKRIEQSFANFMFVGGLPLRIGRFETAGYRIGKELLLDLLTDPDKLGTCDGIELAFGLRPADQAQGVSDRFEVHLLMRGTNVVDGKIQVDALPVFATHGPPTHTTIKIHTRPTNQSEEQA
jgi:hypothetical protein